MSSITIRGCCIGAGRPKVILPIVARTEDDILREARRPVSYTHLTLPTKLEV